MKRFGRVRALIALTGVALAGTSCKASSGVDLVQVSATGNVDGVTFLDANGNGISDGQDQPLPQVEVVLTATRGGAPVAADRADGQGFFEMTGIPVGSYRLSLNAASAGDSLSVSGGGASVLVRNDSTSHVGLPISFPALTFEEVLQADPGQRVFTSGIALNPRPNFGDGVVHLQSDTLYLRMTNVARTTIATGDSLRVLGRVARNNGQTILDEVTPFVLVNLATIPVPLERGTGAAASAQGGKIDAALLRVRAALISDTSTVDGNFHFFVDDGTGALEVVVRTFLQVDPSPIRPDTIVRAQSITGLLVPHAEPTGGVRWQLQPRAGSEVVLEVKQANLGIQLQADTLIAQQGDTILFTSVLSNQGPLGASGIQVFDSVPVGLTFVSASATHGTYADTTGIWALDTLALGKQDTLEVRATVSTPLVGTTPARAIVRPPLWQVDPVTSNNTATLVITLQPPTNAPGHAPSAHRQPARGAEPPGREPAGAR